MDRQDARTGRELEIIRVGQGYVSELRFFSSEVRLLGYPAYPRRLKG